MGCTNDMINQYLWISLWGKGTSVSINKIVESWLIVSRWTLVWNWVKNIPRTVDRAFPADYSAGKAAHLLRQSGVYAYRWCQK